MIDKIMILAKIEVCNIGEEINIGELGDTYYETVRFTQESINPHYEETSGRYSWIAKCNSNYSHRTAFPLRGSYVIFFKTLKGAKRNFLKRYHD